MHLKIVGGTVKFDRGFIEAPNSVLEAKLIDDLIIVICDYTEYRPNAPARNLYAYSKDGLQLWVAADIGMGATDAYTNIVSESPFVVGNFAGFNVFINLRNGRVTKKVFTK